jgi:hypothetical protein
MADLDHLLRGAQRRNRAEGITGLLIYDQGCFFQWLEGPKTGLQRVWESIRHDSRHTDFKILRHEMMPHRLFGGWDMRLARRTRGEIDRTLASMAAPHELLGKLRIQPSVLAAGAWDEVFAQAVLPQLRPEAAACGRGGRELRLASRDGGARPVWHAHAESGAELAGVLRAVDPGGTPHYIDALLEQGAGIEPLFHEVFEPAARCLGGLWEDDRCDDFHLTLALARLQLEVRRLGTILPRQEYGQPARAVLVALQPGELHGLDATMSSELFFRDGWDVSYITPTDDNDLRRILHEEWFDVLDLSLSTALRRDAHLPCLRSTIRAARDASLNAALAVIVGGRSFFERPDAYRGVGADAGCATCIDGITAAHAITAAPGEYCGARELRAGDHCGARGGS